MTILRDSHKAVLARDLVRRGLRVERQKPISVTFEGMLFDQGFRADLIVEQAVVVEVKSVTEHLRDGIKRVANGPLRPSASSV